MGERAYMYAKACGIVGKSFIGRGMSRLVPVSRLSELDRLVFPESARDLPEQELLIDLERRICGRAVERIDSVIRSFSKPPEFLVLLLRSYEYADVKSCLNGIIAGETVPPHHVDLGRFGTVKFEAFPDLQRMLGGTEFAFLSAETLSAETAELLQTKLDQRYYQALWRAMDKLRRDDCRMVRKILREEISLRNAGWALRLRTYYGMDAEAIRARLVSLGPEGNDAFTADTAASLDFSLDNPEEWRQWKPVNLLNPEQPGEGWKADPRYFQNAAAAYLYHLMYRALRRRPFSMDTAACFIKLMQFEEDYLTSLAEGLSLGMPAPDVFALLETQL
jgi:vacuolar-type H+-ATPase subunit C/Vma6